MLRITRLFFGEIFLSWVDSVLAKGKPFGFSMSVGWMDSETLEELKKLKMEPQTPIIAIDDRCIVHMRRPTKVESGKALTIEEIKMIPQIIRKPEAVVVDKRDKKVLYVFPSLTDPRKNKIVVETDFFLKRRA